MEKDLFDGLRKQLEEQDWPALYFFKFICPSDDETVAKIVGLFGAHSDINFQPSTKGKYTSISVKEVMLSAERVIDVYKEAGKVKGVISL
jgi:putative lipoic acid-binding regulatory protein